MTKILTPDEIRAIRESMGLTQSQAGTIFWWWPWRVLDVRERTKETLDRIEFSAALGS